MKRFLISGILSALLVTLSLTTLVFANYNELTKDLEAYVPPIFVIDSISSGGTAVETKEDLGSQQSPAFDDLKNTLEKDHRNATRSPLNIPFLKDINTESLKRLKRIATQKDILLKHLGQELVIGDIEVFAALRNPAVLSAQKYVTAEIESFNQVLNLERSLSQFSAFTEDLNPKAGPLKMKDAIGLKTPYPGVGALKGQVVNHQVNILKEKKQIAQKKAITDIRKAFWKFVFIDTAQKIDKETIEALKRLKTVATSLYKAGKTSFQDIIKINIKIAILNEDLVTLIEQKKNSRKRILEILDLPQGHALGTPVFKLPSKKIDSPMVLYPIARENRPELKVIRQTLKKTQKMMEMAASMIQSDFTMNLSLNEDAAIKTIGTDAPQTAFKQKTMAAMKNNLPTRPWYGIDDPWLKQTKEKLKGLEYNLIYAENATDRMIREAWFKVDKSNRERLLYEQQILDLSTSALQVSTREYESGAIAFSQAIGSYMDWLKVQLTIAKKQMEFGIERSNLEQLLGMSLSYKNNKGTKP